MTVRLLTSIYCEQNLVRKHELLQCLERNLHCSCIDEIWLLQEGNAQPPLQHSKIRLLPVSRRPLYQDFFESANGLCQSDSDISIIANSDIYFDQTLGALARVLLPRQCAALSRWDLRPDGRAVLFDRSDSQDAWIFRGPIPTVVSNFCVGIPRCDNRILYELGQAGYEVLNPAFSVRALHLHSGERSEYPGSISGAFVDPPYAYLFPTNLVSLPQYIAGRFCGQHTEFAWRVSPRMLDSCLLMRILRRLRTGIARGTKAGPERGLS